MTQVSRLDQAVLLLRDRLERLARQDGTASSARAQTGRAGEAPGEPLRRMARDARVSRAELRRALVRTLLTDSFGPELAASLAFQTIADEVAAILERDPETAAMIGEALGELGLEGRGQTG